MTDSRTQRRFFAFLALFFYVQVTVAGDLLHRLYHDYSAQAHQEHSHDGEARLPAADIQLTDFHHDEEYGCAFFAILHSVQGSHLSSPEQAAVLTVPEVLISIAPARLPLVSKISYPHHRPRGPPSSHV
jgi:hypothetical protein